MIVTLKLFDNVTRKLIEYDLFNVKDVIFIHSINKATLVFKDDAVEDVSIDSIDCIKVGVTNDA